MTRFFEALRVTGRDPFVRWQTAAAVVAALAIATQPEARSRAGIWLLHGIPWALITLLLVQILREWRRASAERKSRPRGEAETDDETRFWRDLGLAFAARWLIAPLALVGHLDFPYLPTWAAGGGGGAIVASRIVFCILLISASERRLARRASWASPPAERWIRWPAGAFFVFGLGHYLVLLPAIAGEGVREAGPGGSEAFAWPADPASSAILFLVLDLFAAGYLTAQAVDNPSPRWRAVLINLAIALLLMSGADLVRTITPGSITSASAPALLVLGTSLLWLSPYPCFAFATALRRARFAPRAPGATAGKQLMRGGGGIMVLAALVFPTLHVVIHHFGLLEPGLREAREAVVITAVLVLGSAAYLEQRYQEARTTSLWQEQRKVEASLRSSEKDLRLILERQRTSDELRRSEEKFARAFAASPDGLVISSLETGRIQEVNRSFRRIFALGDTPVEGKRGSDLGLWPDEEIRDRVVRRLERRGAIRDLGFHHRSRDGRDFWLQVSFEALQLGQEPLLLTVVRDMTALQTTAEGKSDGAREEVARLMERSEALRWAAAPIHAEDEQGRVLVWNESARRRLRADGGDPTPRPTYGGLGHRIPVDPADTDPMPTADGSEMGGWPSRRDAHSLVLAPAGSAGGSVGAHRGRDDPEDP
ncbi:MAG: PAS domain S-box protein [Holophagales bacterium]|nr:PAS domain S-box protein [Holophagales bacterium]